MGKAVQGTSSVDVLTRRRGGGGGAVHYTFESFVGEGSAPRSNS